MCRIAFVWIALLLTACSTGYAPVYDQSLDGRAVEPRLTAGDYRVQSGDTLFGIAFKLGVDPKALQERNNIRDKNRIFVGQVLKTDFPKENSSQRSTQSSASSASEPAKSTAKTEPQTKSKPAANSAAAVVSNIKWGWPHSGKVLAKFSPAEGGNKGLDISGQIGDPVVAAADGTVVYAGSGLLGYGNLVIISHNQDYLSAYAHNSRILVRENQKVKYGEPVAELGNTGASVPMLHFEVRRDGRPVDPMRYLPKR